MEEGARRAAEERAEKLPHECSQCHFMKPAGVYVCPKCGHKPLAGEDIDTDTGRKLKNWGRAAPADESRETSRWSQIKFYQRQRVSLGKSLSAMRCSHTFRERFGVWPNGLSDYPMDITPTVSNFIKHKQISFAKQREKEQRLQKQAEEQPNPARVQQALNRVSDIRQQLGKRA